jgi:alkanesulfonate monooxygenase SsuD/methylene tetrahydromethanopterin reductase-like flavin-dependent oxidoreductase (luciferase family)
MEFGICFDTHIDKWELIRYVEELGYDRAWVPDSQMIWSDCYATMALAAHATKRIKIGTGVSIPGTRIAPVTAHSIATINQIAPGRVFLGIGTGHTAMRVMGQHPMPLKEFREYLRVIRALLQGEAVEYTYGGVTREITFIHRDRHFINLDNPIPIYVAANGPKACAAAGAYSDGWITWLTSITAGSAEIGAKLAQIETGARKTARKLPQPFLKTAFVTGCVLRPSEKLTDERVIQETGSYVTAILHFAYETWSDLGQKDELIPTYFRNVWDRYLEHVASFSLPLEKRFRQIHEGHCTFMQRGEEVFVTPEAIRSSCLVGTPEEIADQLTEMERDGIDGISLVPPAEYQRKVFRDFSEQVMPLMRHERAQ